MVCSTCHGCAVSFHYLANIYLASLVYAGQWMRKRTQRFSKTRDSLLFCCPLQGGQILHVPRQRLSVHSNLYLPISPWGGGRQSVRRTMDNCPPDELHWFKTGLLRCVGGVGFCPKHQTREGKQVPWGLCSSVHAAGACHWGRADCLMQSLSQAFWYGEAEGGKMITQRVMHYILWRI